MSMVSTTTEMMDNYTKNSWNMADLIANKYPALMVYPHFKSVFVIQCLPTQLLDPSKFIGFPKKRSAIRGCGRDLLLVEDIPPTT